MTRKQESHPQRRSDGGLLAELAVVVLTWLLKAIVFLIAPFALLWWGTGYLNTDQLRWLLAGTVWLLAPFFMLGLEAGKTEARGFVGGIDTAVSKLAAAVDLRDNSRARAAAQRQALTAAQRQAQAPQAAQFNVYLPDPAALAGAVPISHRQIAGGGDVVDL